MHACLYGLAHAVIVALGCAPGLGFVHVGHECSFVYDIADLYKAEVTIPIAFEVAAHAPEDLPAVVRRRVRDAMVEHHILERMVHDIRWLLLTEEEQLFPAHAGVIPRRKRAGTAAATFPRIRGGDPIAKTKIEPSGGTHEEPDGSRSRLPDGSKKNIAQNDAPVKKNTFPRIRGGDPYFTMLWTAYRDFSPHTRG